MKRGGDERKNVQLLTINGVLGRLISLSLRL